MKEPFVLIYTTCYNSEEYIEDTIRSIVEQTYSNWKYVIVDDGSTDNSIELIQNWQEKDDRIQLIESEHEGIPAAGRNKAIRSYDAIWYANCDSDDIWLSDKLEIQISMAKQYPKYKIVAVDHTRFSDTTGEILPSMSILDRNISRIRSTTHENLEILFPPSFFFLFSNFVPNSGVIYHRDVYETVGYLDVNPEMPGGDDYNFLMRSICRGYEVMFINKALVNYRVRERSYKNITKQSDRRLHTLNIGLECKDWEVSKILVSRRKASLQLVHTRLVYLSEGGLFNFLDLQIKRIKYYGISLLVKLIPIKIDYELN